MVDPLTLTLCATVGTGAAYLSPALTKPLAIRALQRRATARRALVLTYDDGPGPETTRALMPLIGWLQTK